MSDIERAIGCAMQESGGLQGGLQLTIPSVRQNLEDELKRTVQRSKELTELLKLFDRNPDFERMLSLMRGSKIY